MRIVFDDIENKQSVIKEINEVKIKANQLFIDNSIFETGKETKQIVNHLLKDGYADLSCLKRVPNEPNENEFISVTEKIDPSTVVM